VLSLHLKKHIHTTSYRNDLIGQLFEKIGPPYILIHLRHMQPLLAQTTIPLFYHLTTNRKTVKLFHSDSKIFDVIIGNSTSSYEIIRILIFKEPLCSKLQRSLNWSNIRLKIGQRNSLEIFMIKLTMSANKIDYMEEQLLSSPNSYRFNSSLNRLLKQWEKYDAL